MANTAANQQTLTFKGLTLAEVEVSRKKHGANVLTPPEREPWWKQFLEKFDDPVIRILMIAAVIAIGAGALHNDYLEGVGIMVAILLATTLAFLNEYKANKEFDILNQVNDEVPIKVIRDGNFTTVPRKDLVVGDVVLVELGEETPADGRILEAVSLQIDESRLTGESVPVTKMAAEAAGHSDKEKELAYPVNKLMRGTMVVDGHGIIELTAVGDSTEIGKTARAAAEETGEETPLNAQLERLSKLIGVVGLLVAALTYAALFVRGILVDKIENGVRVIGLDGRPVKELDLDSQQWYFVTLLTVSTLIALIRVWLPIIYDALELARKEVKPPEWLEKESLLEWLKTIGLGALIFGIGIGVGRLSGLLTAEGQWLSTDVGEALLGYFMIAVTIIVVAVPEGLAMSVTLSLAYSMRKMTAANNLVRKMHACETIGAATVICSDKTGTLTLNEMRVHEVNFPALKNKALTKNLSSQSEKLIVEAITANTTANLSRNPNEPPRPLGNPTEGALLMWLENSGVDYIYHRTAFPITFQWTFSTERKFMGTLGISNATGKQALHVKGAPEIVLERCSKVLTEQGPQPLASYRQNIEKGLLDYQARGMRTLALAYHEAPQNHQDANVEDLAYEMTWLGFVAIADPVRPEVPPAIKECRDAGIAVKMVTGDNPETAQEIARQIGLVEKDKKDGNLLLGREFAQLGDDEARNSVTSLKVLARARPMDKMRLVKLLQDGGHVVAVTGDGTNDAPALNYANVGLAMGKTGTSVAKEASDIILLDDSFRSIVNAVMWGRSLYQNIQRFILFQLTINVAALGIALLGPFIGVALPLTVIQMLWINLIMDTFAALALATEPPHPSVMKRPPRQSKDFIVTNLMAKNIFTMASVFLVVLIGFLLYYPLGNDLNVITRERSMFYTIFVLLQFWNLFNARSMGTNRSAFADIMQNKAFLAIAASIFVGQILITELGGQIFKTKPLAWEDWLLIIGGTSLVLWIGELWRWFKRIQVKSA